MLTAELVFFFTHSFGYLAQAFFCSKDLKILHEQHIVERLGDLLCRRGSGFKLGLILDYLLRILSKQLLVAVHLLELLLVCL